MLKRPLVLICLLFIPGIFVGSILQLNFLFCCGCLLGFFLGAVFTVHKKVLFIVFLSLTCFFLGYCHYPNEQNLFENHIRNFTPVKGLSVQIRGFVISEVMQKKRNQCFNLKTSELIVNNKKYSVQGKIQVNLFSDAKVEYGQELILTGKLYQPYNFSDGKFDCVQHLKNKSIYSILSVAKNNKLEYAGRNPGNLIKQSLFKLREKQGEMIDRYLSPNSAGIIKAMLLGERYNVPKFFNLALQRTGTVHILAVSGLHTGIIIFIILILLKILQVPFRLRYGLTIIFIILYCVFTGGRISVIRSTIMAVVFLAGFIIDRDYDTYSSLALSALLILWFMPGQIFEIGFQLSFASVLAIIIFHNKITIGLYSLEIKNWQKNLISGIGVSFCAWLGTLGLVAYYFSIISPISVIANLFIVPLLFMVIASGLLFITLGSLIPVLCSVLALNCEFFISLIYRIADFLSAVPGAYFNLPEISLIFVFSYYILLFSAFFINDLKQFVRNKKHIANG